MTLTPAGEYAGDIADQGFGIIEPGRKPFWWLTCTLRARLSADGRVVPCPAFRRTVRFPFPGGDVAALLEAVATLGVTLDQISTSSPDFTRLAGRPVVLRCDHRVVRGRAEEVWRLVSAPAPVPVGDSPTVAPATTTAD